METVPCNLRIKIEINQPFVLSFSLIVTSRVIYGSHFPTNAVVLARHGCRAVTRQNREGSKKKLDVIWEERGDYEGIAWVAPKAALPRAEHCLVAPLNRDDSDNEP